MVNDEIFMRFDEGIFKPYFEKFIELELPFLTELGSVRAL